MYSYVWLCMVMYGYEKIKKAEIYIPAFILIVYITYYNRNCIVIPDEFNPT